MPPRTSAKRPLPETCPILSAPAHRGGGGKNVPCIGTRCALFRADLWDCALLEMPRLIDKVQEVMTATRHFTTTSADEISQGAQEKISRALGGVEEEFRGTLRQFTELRGSLESEVSGASESMTSAAGQLEKAESELASLVDGLRSELMKLKEDEHVAAARKAADTAIDHLARGNLQDACVLLEQAMEEAGPNPALLNVLGCVHLAQENRVEAERAFRSCIELDPAFASAQVNLGQLLLSKGRLDEAEMTLREGLRLAPESGACWNSLGNLLFARGRGSEAVDAWSTALEHDPGSDAAWENLRRQQVHDGGLFEDLIDAAGED
ncbi:MAG: tetratricopeptide repeat protein [Planctomycetota bacterium]